MAPVIVILEHLSFCRALESFGCEGFNTSRASQPIFTCIDGPKRSCRIGDSQRHPLPIRVQNDHAIYQQFALQITSSLLCEYIDGSRLSRWWFMKLWVKQTISDSGETELQSWSNKHQVTPWQSSNPLDLRQIGKPFTVGAARTNGILRQPTKEQRWAQEDEMFQRLVILPQQTGPNPKTFGKVWNKKPSIFMFRSTDLSTWYLCNVAGGIWLISKNKRISLGVRMPSTFTDRMGSKQKCQKRNKKHAFDSF